MPRVVFEEINILTTTYSGFRLRAFLIVIGNHVKDAYDYILKLAYIRDESAAGGIYQIINFISWTVHEIYLSVGAD